MHTETAKEIILAWLYGKTGNIPGERVVVHTYGAAYLGVFTEEEFVTRLHVEGAKLKTSSLRGPERGEHPFTTSCAAAIEELRKAGVVTERPCRAYNGSAVLYRLAA